MDEGKTPERVSLFCLLTKKILFCSHIYEMFTHL